MKRIVLSLALLTCAVALRAQTPSDSSYDESVDEAPAERPTYSVYVDASIMTGTLGRAGASGASYGIGVRGGIALVEMHRGSIGGTASANEQTYLGGVSIPLSRRTSLDVLGGVSVMDGYAEGALLYTTHVGDFEYFLTQLITGGYGSSDRTREHYEHHALGTGPAVRIVLAGMLWDAMRVGLSVDARTELKPHTTHVGAGVSLQLGWF